MIRIKLGSRHAIMSARLIERINAGDYRRTVTPAVQHMLARHARIELLVIDVRQFAGWGAVGTFAEQARFLRRFGSSIARVAVLGCAAWAGAVPAIGRLFMASEVRSFTPGEEARLRAWMRVALRETRWCRRAVAGTLPRPPYQRAMLLL